MSQICTRSLQSAQTRPAPASSVGLKGLHAPSCAAVTSEEKNEKDALMERRVRVFSIAF